MTYAKLIPALALLAIALSGCSDIKGALEFVDDRDDFRDRRDALESRSNSAFSAIPDTGTTTYRGEASLAVGTNSQGVILLGDAAITVDYDSGEVDGRLTSFGGFDRGENFSDYSGTLVFANGEIGVDRPNDLESGITGTLRGESHTIDVDAHWEGDHKGTPIRGILGETVGRESTFELNGNAVPGGISIAVTQ